MTADREEKLIDDVAWMRGQLETYFKSVAPTLATKESVDAVEHRITEHVENHKEGRTLWPVWIGVAVTGIVSVASFAIGFIKKG